MSTQQIPREEWTSFFYGFSRNHRGWLVTLEVFERLAGGLVKARDLPLEEIALETSSDTELRLRVLIRDVLEGHVRHTLSSPAEVLLEKGPDGAEVALEVEGRSGETLILRFRAPLRAQPVVSSG
jgi:hypothetical protein